MNYLGHLYLSPDTPDFLVGSLLGDFVKGAAVNDYTGDTRRGIELHRKVDQFTDHHDIFRQSVARISQGRRRYGGIMVDVFYDHFLAKHWLEFHSEPLADFAQRVYGILRERELELPETLQLIAPRLIAEDRFSSYQRLDGIDLVLKRLSLRIKRENPLHSAIEELAQAYEGFEADFRQFLPEVKGFVNQTVNQRPDS